MNEPSIPSWISFSDYHKNRKVKIGSPAKFGNDIRSVLYDSKKLIGNQFERVRSDDIQHWGFSVQEKTNEENDIISLLEVNIPQMQKKEQFMPEEVQAIICQLLMNRCQKILENNQIGKIVFGVPILFNDFQKEATVNALEIIGLTNVNIINESSAALLEYIRMYPELAQNGHKLMLIDCGGGFLDVSCATMTNGELTIVRCGGNGFTAGNNVDYIVMDIIKEKLINDFDISEDYWDVDVEMSEEEITLRRYRLAKLKIESERVKMELSQKKVVSVNLKGVFREEPIPDHIDGVIISREEFEERMKENGFIDEFVKTVEDVMKRAKFTKTNVRNVILQGGTCQIPCIREAMENIFYKNKILHPDLISAFAVSKGAAFYAFTLECPFGITIRLKDTIPYPIGFEINGGRFDMFIEDGTPLPCRKTKRYKTTDDYQTSVQFKIFTGFGSFTDLQEMQHIDTIIIDKIPKAPKGKITFEVTMMVSASGRVSMTAETIDTTNGKGFMNNSVKLSISNQMKRSLKNSFEQSLRHSNDFLKDKKKKKGFFN